MQPVTKTEQVVADLLHDSGVETNITLRWEQGTPHHPQAEALALAIAAVDWLCGGDRFALKFGGDGDSGEHLAYLLDILFEARERERKNEQSVSG